LIQIWVEFRERGRGGWNERRDDSLGQEDIHGSFVISGLPIRVFSVKSKVAGEIRSLPPHPKSPERQRQREERKFCSFWGRE